MPEQSAPSHPPQQSISLLAQAKQWPLTAVLILLSILGALLVEFDSNLSLVRQLLYFDFSFINGRMRPIDNSGEYWRLITPIFLHFGILHITFNSLWLMDLGRGIELTHGRMRLAGLVLLIAMGSNITQAVVSGPAMFGGMSGVIYGLLGYCVVWSWRRPGESFGIHRGVVIFMLVWLVLCFFGIAKLLGAGEVANGAHLGGLIMGAALGLIASFIDVKNDGSGIK